MKRSIIILALIFVFIALFILSCSEKRDILDVPTHPHDWLDNPQSAQFHGNAVLETGPNNCQSCHGKDYKGGTANVSCFTCHELYPHSDNWKEKTVHGASIVADLYKLDDCQECHGENYQGGSSKISCYQCHALFPHQDNWLSPEADEFHGKLILNNEDKLDDCKSCHGNEYTGGSSGVACFTCHSSFPHPDGFKNSESGNFHGKFIGTLNWRLDGCQECHGSDYKGKGTEAKNCTVCHTQPDGPEACNTCHGNNLNPAPPEDLLGNGETTFVGVGAHQAHLNDSTYTTAFTKDCNICHKMPATYSDPGHIDNTPHSELAFSSFASDSGKVTPTWNHENATCENVYCHGAFVFKKSESSASWGYAADEIKGNNVTMIWNNVGVEQDSCGSCHGLPPTGHAPQTTCNSCHGRVVDADFNIINKKLHINGNIELF